MSDLVKKFKRNTKLATLATKGELKAEKDKIAKVETFDLNYFHCKSFYDHKSFQIMFVYRSFLIP